MLHFFHFYYMKTFLSSFFEKVESRQSKMILTEDFYDQTA